MTPTLVYVCVCACMYVWLLILSHRSVTENKRFDRWKLCPSCAATTAHNTIKPTCIRQQLGLSACDRRLRHCCLAWWHRSPRRNSLTNGGKGNTITNRSHERFIRGVKSQSLRGRAQNTATLPPSRKMLIWTYKQNSERNKFWFSAGNNMMTVLAGIVYPPLFDSRV